ncbi:MAG: hypothetical protein J6K48_01665 [Lachnospiraceae bacterium]|nr:hypothetical protein [Lachnospiraceae bacterium]
MEIAVKDMIFNNKTVRNTLFDCLDKGIDDVEAGRVHAVEEAFQIVKERMKDELQGSSDG